MIIQVKEVTRADIDTTNVWRNIFSHTVFRAIVEWGLLAAAFSAIWFILPRGIFFDGDMRLFAIANLIDHHTISNMSYSMIGPIFSAPLWIVGKHFGYPFVWIGKYNEILFLLGLGTFWLLLRNRIDRILLRTFLLLLTSCSLFPNLLTYFGGEVFTALCVGIGLVAVLTHPRIAGWIAIVLGVASTPATLAGLVLVLMQHIWNEKRLRYILPGIAVIGIILTESWIRRGSPFTTGYEGGGVASTQAPVWQRLGFTYPFFFGLISILFSFGKGLIFFTPGFFLSLKNALDHMKGGTPSFLKNLHRSWIWFSVGLILVYSPWSAWYGGWFWGPRFFLFLSLPASLALAIRLRDTTASLAANTLTLLGVLLSAWVGINGAIFNQNNMGSTCLPDNYANEFFCHYLPNYSALWRPFVAPSLLNHHQLLYIGITATICLYLAMPLCLRIAKQLRVIGAGMWSTLSSRELQF